MWAQFGKNEAIDIRMGSLGCLTAHGAVKQPFISVGWGTQAPLLAPAPARGLSFGLGPGIFPNPAPREPGAGSQIFSPKLPVSASHHGTAGPVCQVGRGSSTRRQKEPHAERSRPMSSLSQR